MDIWAYRRPLGPFKLPKTPHRSLVIGPDLRKTLPYVHFVVLALVSATVEWQKPLGRLRRHTHDGCAVRGQNPYLAPAFVAGSAAPAGARACWIRSKRATILSN